MARDLHSLCQSLRENHPIVLVAPPGTGKTTTIPPALLSEPWLSGKKILVLEPRRLAARRAAQYIARTLGEKAGETVGWRVRLDACVSSKTRIEFLTEGLLARRILTDPELSDVGLIIFDEFHERSLALDTAFALMKEVRETFRPDLRILVMSATLSRDILPEAVFLEIPGKAYPVTIQWCGPITPQTAVLKALRETSGSILVFLPGEGEIRALAESLSKSHLPENTRIAPLYAALSHAEQDQAVAPPHLGERKIVLATSIAESSITIEGIEVVIDTGLARVPQFSSRNGLTRLVTQRIPLDRVTQRSGRAGRTAPGICYRLWNQLEEVTFSKISQPEILSADLTQTALQCAEWGAQTLEWLTPPPPSAWQCAWQTLRSLDAIDATNRITALGRRIIQFPVHPALAAMMLKMEPIDRAGGALLAAIYAEGERIHALRQLHDFRRVVETVLEERPQAIWQLATQWAKSPPIPKLPLEELLPYLLWAFPGHVAKRRDRQTGRYLLSAGFGAVLPQDSLFITAPWLFAVRMTDGDAEAMIRWAFPLTEHDLKRIPTQTQTRIEWDKTTNRLIAAEEVCYGAIVVKSRPLTTIPPALYIEAERCRLQHEGLPWTKTTRALTQRIAFLRKHLPEMNFPKMTDATLIDALAENPKQSLQAAISECLAQYGHTLYEIDTLAPTHYRVPSGSNLPIQYDADQPYLMVKIQEVFGLTATPRLANNRIPLLLHLLSPAQRPVQITSDLSSFWKNGYAIVRKDLRGRYPKHYWPEDPTQAIASKRTLKPKP
ncbi:MAG: ATP-dependent helicase HrpB [Kiritimatiellae bacterium]|nr:ATP-dependent helicase HrpB [Kiritimatiellia bacterium]